MPNIFRYSGEYWDKTTNLQYLRARWYDPSIGRFITEDPFEGELTNPLSLNPYTYVENNPLIYTDPTGEIANCIMRCFSAGTKVQTDEGYKAIETIEVGDKVLAKNEETGELAYKEVEETFQRVAEETYHVTVAGTTMITTEEHPFWVPGTGWVEAKDLKVGDRLVDNEGKEYPIESIEIEKEKRTVYNFRVNGYHNYFVTDLSIWTHNCGSGARSLGGLGTVARSYPPTGGGGTYNRPANVSRGPVGVKIEISLPKNIDQFYRSGLKKGLEYNKGTPKAGTSSADLSQNLVDHILNRHSVNSTKKQLPYLQKKMSDKQIDAMLGKKSFFNKEWSDKKITEASTLAVNQLKQQGVTDGLHTVTVFGEPIKVFIRNGNVDSVYGTNIYKLSNLLD